MSDLEEIVLGVLKSIHYRQALPEEPVCGRGSNACSSCTDGLSAEDIAYHVANAIRKQVLL